MASPHDSPVKSRGPGHEQASPYLWRHRTRVGPPPLRTLAWRGNRTHPGRLSSAPQTVLKTAFSSSNGVRRRPLQIENGPRESTDIHGRPSSSAKLAVSLAVTTSVIHQRCPDSRPGWRGWCQDHQTVHHEGGQATNRHRRRGLYSTAVRRDLEGLTGRESVSSTRPGQISSRLAGEVRVLRHDRANERDARIELNEGS
jgi:hypothetical protein